MPPELLVLLNDYWNEKVASPGKSSYLTATVESGYIADIYTASRTISDDKVRDGPHVSS